MPVDTQRSNTITIIGCGGFIGSHLIETLLQDTHFRIIGVDIASAKISHIPQNDRFSFIQADMHDLSTVKPLIGHCGTAVFLAALCNPSLYNTKPVEVIDVNCIGTIPLVSMCVEAGTRLVYFSTCEVYGKTAGSIVGGTDSERNDLLSEAESQFILGPVAAQRWNYSCAKQLVERYVYGCGQERGLEYTIVRPFNFIGPRMDFLPGIDGKGIPRVLACFLTALIKGEPLKLVDGGKNCRCFTYIDDAIDACIKIIENPAGARNRIFNIGNPANETTIADLARRMVEIWREIVPESRDKKIVIEDVPSRDFYGLGYEDSDRRVPDITEARTLLGWEPRANLHATLELTMRSYADKYASGKLRG